MEKSIDHKIIIHNCHIHTFTNKDIPRNFYPMGIVRFISRYHVGFARWLNNRIKQTGSDLFDRYANFLRLISCEEQEDIFNYIRQFYPTNTLTKFVVLSMDMNYMQAGSIKRGFREQLEKLSKLKEKLDANDEFTEIIPFIAIDPRRPEITSLVKEFVEQNGFGGLKLYPPLGYFPYDERLNDIYQYAEDHNLPIIAHCSKSGPVYYRASKRKIIEELEQKIDYTIFPEPFYKRKSKKELCNYFTHPLNYVKILKNFPKLRICLAHFGGGSQWSKWLNPTTVGVCEELKKTANNKKKKEFLEATEPSWFGVIYDMIKEYPNLYTDISFTLSNLSYLPMLKIILLNKNIQHKILFGSDFFMTEIETSDRKFSIDIRGYLGEDLYKKIVIENPKEFLKL
ncbi:MAG: amidohydrolase family protein [Asgard group archaeon]|nr:amidohydrolase family protein [Asgard group archaeon]